MLLKLAMERRCLAWLKQREGQHPQQVREGALGSLRLGYRSEHAHTVLGTLATLHASRLSSPQRRH